MEGHRKFAGFGDIEIYYDGFLSAANHDGFDRLVCARVHLLMRYPGRNVDEIARSGFLGKFQMVAPTEASPAFHDVKDGLDLAMMVRGGAGGRFHYDGSGPQL